MYYYFYLFSTSETSGVFFLCLALDRFCLFSQRSGRYVVNFPLVTFCTINSGALGVLKRKEQTQVLRYTLRRLLRFGYPGKIFGIYITVPAGYSLLFISFPKDCLTEGTYSLLMKIGWNNYVSGHFVSKCDCSHSKKILLAAYRILRHPRFQESLNANRFLPANGSCFKDLVAKIAFDPTLKES